jgi:hypothetical protein
MDPKTNVISPPENILTSNISLQSNQKIDFETIPKNNI